MLEALHELLGGILDRDAWQWPQAFYLPSCPASRKGDAFEVPNKGALLPVDAFVARARAVITAKSTSMLAPPSN